MVDIFDEVQEDLRAERAQRLAKKYGWVVALAAVLVIVGAAGWEFYQRRQVQQDQVVAARYIGIMNAINQGPSILKEARTAQVDPLLKLAAASPPGYKAIIRLRAAGLLADSGKIKEASSLYYEVATDNNVDPQLRDLAQVLMYGWQLDNADPKVLEPRLQALAQPGTPWAPLAQEQLAVLDLRQGKVDDARTKLKALANDVLAPAGVRARANALLQGLG
ncbi:MAG TPA: tetratricopeptide repeat protein [Rhodopila sp.]|nr:tetratricopeptide repeat protein [Rhodopila sp.]